MRPRILGTAVFLFSFAAAFAAEWTKIENCRLVADEYRDGDSFHVTTGDKDYIFRLYFVDCPESDNRFPERVAAQAKYFGISSPASIALGTMAAAATQGALSQPFTVYTKFLDARGSSKQHRFYAIVETPLGDLGSLLVSMGFVRIFGMPVATLPDGKSSKDYIAKLKTIEAKARTAKVGGWGIGSGGEARPEVSQKIAPGARDEIPAF